MSWALSASGKKDKVRTNLKAQVEGIGCDDEGEKQLAAQAALLIDKFVEDFSDDEAVTVNANGALSGRGIVRRHTLNIQIVPS
jgi:hypothetical protein